MNLHNIASGVISSVNPQVPAIVQVSTGPGTTQASGKRVPTYAAPQTVPAQVQALTYKDIQQIEGLNLQGTRRAIYFYGHVEGLVRVSNRGGDLVTLPDGSTWLVAMVLETWPDWSKVVATMQLS